MLGITAGKATLILGGEQGEEVTVQAGDVIVIPAGVGHFNKNSSRDFEVVGAYPDGMSWDMCYGKPEERPEKIENIKEAPLPETDPVFGEEGPLLEEWS